jgi:hypothetical protein
MASRERERRRHRPLTSEALKKREDQKGGLYDSLAKEDIKVWRPKPGAHTVRFFEGTWPDAEHWAHDTWIHNNIGPDGGRYLCLKKMLGKPCSLCDETSALRAAGEEKASKDIGVRKGAAAWLIDRDAEEEGPQLWFYGRTVDEEMASRCRDRKTGDPIDVIHPDEGNDFFFKSVKEGKDARNVKYVGIELDRDPTPIHDKERVQDKWRDYVEDNPVPDCLNYYDNEYLKGLITGSNMAKSADDDDDEDERPSRSRRSRNIDDDDADVEDDEPVSKRRRQRDDSDDDDDPPPKRRRVVDDDDDDDPPPRRSRRDAVDDDEDEPPPRNRSKNRSRDEEEEDAPPPRKPRSRLSEDLDDEIPSRRRGGNEDEPASRRRPKDEDDDEPAPKRKRQRLEADDDEDVVSQAKRQLSKLKDEETGDDDDPPPRRNRR